MVKVLRYSFNINSDIKRGWSAYAGMRFDTEEEARNFFESDDLDICFDSDRNSFGVVHHDGLSCFLVEEDGDKIADVDFLRNRATLTQAEYTLGKVTLLHSFGDDWHLLECPDYGKESVD